LNIGRATYLLHESKAGQLSPSRQIEVSSRR
jgi:hypothetical protein